MSAKNKLCPKCGTLIYSDAKQCRPCRTAEATRHGTLTAYRRGCRCDACVVGARKKRSEQDRARKKPCIQCGTLITYRSTRCVKCANVIAPAEILRSIDNERARNVAWRPAWYPPACPTCNGFGYVRGSWSTCPSCRQHPGHQCSHEEWTATR